jgi:hypothetical protein
LTSDATPTGSFRLDCSGKGLVEAAGIEPASEKDSREETTCVADSKFSAATSEPARVMTT